jgi:hypothetical protein
MATLPSPESRGSEIEDGSRRLAFPLCLECCGIGGPLFLRNGSNEPMNRVA